jgi:tetratricopeptide (TPR) repeat protein
MPLYLRPAFLAVPSVLGLAFASAWFALRRAAPDRPTVTRRRRRSKAVVRELERMEASARAGDALSFLRAAQAALGRAESQSDEIRQLFALADEANYSGRAPATLDFARWTRVVRDHCAQALLLVVLIMGGWQAHAQPAGQSAPGQSTMDQTTAEPSASGQSGGPAATVLSAAALYNLANAYAREGRAGMAVLNYERALLLAPDDPDIEANLRYVRQATRLPDEPRSRFAGLGLVAGPTALAWLGVAGMVIAAAALLAARHWRRRRRRLVCVVAVFIGAALVALTVCNAVLVWPALHESVVVAASAAARVAPAPLGDPLFTLPEGDTVRMTAEHEGFFLVKTSKGQTGWVAQAELAAVVPRD